MPDIKFLSQRKSEIFPDQWYALAREDHFWMQWRLRAFLEQLKALKVDLNAPCKVLEIGCGDGVLRRQLEASSSWVIDGADINMEALNRTPLVRGDTFFYDIFDRRSEFAGSYDVIILFDVLEHIADEKAFLDAVRFHLKKDGMLYINVPALQGLFSRYDEAVGHLRRYDKAMMATLAGSAGLEMVNMRYWGFSMLPLLSLRRAMVKNEIPSQATIKRGFEPPGALANKAMKALMGLETSIFRDPPSGTSLLAAVQPR
jgi:SAM-dependent methyltransferase